MTLLLLAALIALLFTGYVVVQRRRRAAREAAALEARLRSRKANRVPVVSSNVRGGTAGATQSPAQATRDARTDRSA